MARIKVATRFNSRPYWGRLFCWKEGVIMESDRRFLFLKTTNQLKQRRTTENEKTDYNIIYSYADSNFISMQN